MTVHKKLELKSIGATTYDDEEESANRADHRADPTTAW